MVIRGHHIRRLPVIDEEEDLVGIVIESDLIKSSLSSTTILKVSK